MARGKVVVVRNKKGKQIRLMNPNQKAMKYAEELKNNMHFTNFGEVKTTKSGKIKRLNDNQKSWRSGYLTARKDNARAYKYNQRKRNNVVGYLPYYR